MRNMKLHTACIFTVSTILAIGFDASAQLDPNLEAGVDCLSSECMFHGNSQAHDAIAALQKLPIAASQERMIKVNRYEDNMGEVANRNTENVYAPVGELETVATTKNAEGNDTVSRGSAVLISPCYIITNHHVAFNNDVEPNKDKDYSMKFRFGTSPTAAFRGNTIATPVLDKVGQMGVHGENDWAIMRLKTCVGGRQDLGIGWMEPSFLSKKELAAQGSKVAVAGFAGDHQAGQLSVGVGQVTGYDKLTDRLKYSAPMAAGMSGGPVLVIENGRIKLAGINASEMVDMSNPDKYVFPTFSSEHANKFVSLAEILTRPDIKAMLDHDKALVGENPAATRFAQPLPSTAGQQSI